MPDIIPFHGHRYNPKKISKFEDVLSPPYDVISEKEQRALYQKSPHNFVRVDLRKKMAGGHGYQAAAQELKSWIEQGVFICDEQPSLYVYVQNYRNPRGKPAKRIGFLSLMKINPRKVKKHENTLAGPKTDRTALTESMGAQLSPIFGLFHDRPGTIHTALRTVTQKKPIVDVKMSGVRHRLYIENRPHYIQAIRSCLKPKNMYIADGHHRFEVAYQFHRKNAKKPQTGYIMTYLCDALRNDFTIYPTHRILKGLPAGWEALFEKTAARYFDKEPCGTLNSLLRSLEKTPAGNVAVGCFLKGRYWKLTLRSKTRDLDVSVLHKYFIKKLLGEDVTRSEKIQFERDPLLAVRRVRSKKAQAAFFLSKMPIEEMMRISDEGIKLPQKSTYFYPKLLSGLVFYKF